MLFSLDILIKNKVLPMNLSPSHSFRFFNQAVQPQSGAHSTISVKNKILHRYFLRGSLSSGPSYQIFLDALVFNRIDAVIDFLYLLESRPQPSLVSFQF